MGEGLTLAILAVQTFFKLLNFSFLPIGDFEHLSNINFEIANIFDNSGHHHQAVFYLLRSLENSKQAENGSHEAKVGIMILLSILFNLSNSLAFPNL